MKFLKIVNTIATSAIAAILFAGNAMAQSKILVIDQTKVVLDSDVGKHVTRQIVSISKQMDAEMKAQLTPINAERDKLMVELKNMSVEALKSRPDLQQRAKTYQASSQKSKLEIKYKQRELQITEQKALAKINQKLETILKAVIEERNADILVDRSMVIFSTPTVEITDDVISRLNAQMKTVPVVRERITRKPLPKQANKPAQ